MLSFKLTFGSAKAEAEAEDHLPPFFHQNASRRRAATKWLAQAEMLSSSSPPHLSGARRRLLVSGSASDSLSLSAWPETPTS